MVLTVKHGPSWQQGTNIFGVEYTCARLGLSARTLLGEVTLLQVDDAGVVSTIVPTHADGQRV